MQISKIRRMINTQYKIQDYAKLGKTYNTRQIRARQVECDNRNL